MNNYKIDLANNILITTSMSRKCLVGDYERAFNTLFNQVLTTYAKTDHEPIWNETKTFSFSVKAGCINIESHSSCGITGLFRFSVNFKIDGLGYTYYKSADMDTWERFSDNLFLIDLLWSRLGQMIELMEEKGAKDGI